MTILKNLLLAVAFLIAAPAAYAADAVGAVTYPTYEELTPVQKNTFNKFTPSKYASASAAAEFINKKDAAIAHLLAVKYVSATDNKNKSGLLAAELAKSFPNRVLGITSQIAKAQPSELLNIAGLVAKVSKGQEDLIASELSKDQSDNMVLDIANRIATVANPSDNQKIKIALAMGADRPNLLGGITNALQKPGYVKPGTAIDIAMIAYIRSLIPKKAFSINDKQSVIDTIKTRPSRS